MFPGQCTPVDSVSWVWGLVFDHKRQSNDGLQWYSFWLAHSSRILLDFSVAIKCRWQLLLLNEPPRVTDEARRGSFLPKEVIYWTPRESTQNVDAIAFLQPGSVISYDTINLCTNRLIYSVSYVSLWGKIRPSIHNKSTSTSSNDRIIVPSA